MSDKYFVDTNILMYAHDRSAGAKHERAREVVERLWISGQGVLSTQVLQELCINLRHKVSQPLPAEEIRRLLQDYLSWDVFINTPASVIHALDFELKYKTSFWDALILQAAEGAGATVLYSEDLATNQNYGPIRIVNPLAKSVSTD